MNPKKGAGVTSRVLVYQANGVQGAATLRRVQQAGFRARALVRNSERAEALEALGFEAAIADLNDREALLRAHDSAEHVILQIPAYADSIVRRATENAVAAMQSVNHRSVIVKMANPTSERVVPDSGFSANAIVAEGLRASGIAYSVVGIGFWRRDRGPEDGSV